MSSAEEYAYTFRMIVPEKTPNEIRAIRDQLAEASADSSTPMIVSSIRDYMMLTFNEDTEFPDMRLPYAAMLAKSALREYGINQPVFIKAYATLKNDMKLIDIHKEIMNKAENKHRIDLTDELLQSELKSNGDT